MVVWGIIPISGRSEIGLPPGDRGILFQAMSTLAEIEAAIENLPVDEQRTLLQFVAERVHRSDAVTDDPVQAIIGAYRSGYTTTGEDAEDILYGPEKP